MKERTAKGTAVVNLLNLQPERVDPGDRRRPTTFPKDRFLVFATANGTVKKTAFSEYDKSRREGWIAINLREGDEVVRVVPTSGEDDLMMVTYRGMAIRFQEAEVREMGRDATGVRGIKLRADDKAISLDVVRETPTCSSSPTPALASASRPTGSTVRDAGDRACGPSS